MAMTWEQLENLKQEALNVDDMKHALFYQNEQVIMKMSNITWLLKIISEGK